MNGTVVNIIDYRAVDPGSISESENIFFFFCIFNLFLFCFVFSICFFFVSYFQFVSFLFRIFLCCFFFSFHGERSNYIISLTSEPPITQCNEQLQRNGVHANDFNNVFK